MTVTYQVGGGGHLDIDFWVSTCYPIVPWTPVSLALQLADPNNLALGKHMKQSTGSVSITAEKDGRYEYCFSNQMSSFADKIVKCVLGLLGMFFTERGTSFNVHGIIYVGEDGK